MEKESIRDLLPASLTQADIAKACGVTQQSVCLWLKANQVPARRVEAFMAVSGIPAAKLNTVFNLLAAA